MSNQIIAGFITFNIVFGMALALVLVLTTRSFAVRFRLTQWLVPTT